MYQSSKEEKNVALAYIVNSQGEVLIGRRAPSEPMPGSWEFPGGKFEPGESGQQALERELREELGADALCHELLATESVEYSRGTFQLHLYACELRGSRELELRVHDRLAWCPPHQLLDYDLLPGDIPLVRNYILPSLGNSAGLEDRLDKEP